eukprot:1246693-Amorphochlora_amoeboformis.AAC.2
MKHVKSNMRTYVAIVKSNMRTYVVIVKSNMRTYVVIVKSNRRTHVVIVKSNMRTYVVIEPIELTNSTISYHRTICCHRAFELAKPNICSHRPFELAKHIFVLQPKLANASAIIPGPVDESVAGNTT